MRFEGFFAVFIVIACTVFICLINIFWKKIRTIQKGKVIHRQQPIGQQSGNRNFLNFFLFRRSKLVIYFSLLDDIVDARQPEVPIIESSFQPNLPSAPQIDSELPQISFQNFIQLAQQFNHQQSDVAIEIVPRRLENSNGKVHFF